MKFLLGFLSLVVSILVSLPVSAKAVDLVVLDVRTEEEFSLGHVAGALNVDVLKPDFKEKVSKLDPQKVYKLYCRSGNRSGKALNIMKELGFKELENLGSLRQASQKLNRNCEGKEAC